MRLTIVDLQMFIVYDVIDSPNVWDVLQVIPSDYTNSGYVWFITAHGAQPNHAQHNCHGQIVGEYDRLPRLKWSA